MQKLKKKLMALGLGVGLMSASLGVNVGNVSNANAITMSAANLESTIGARFMVTRLDLAKKTAVIALRDASVKRATLVFIEGLNSDIEGVADIAAFTGDIQNDDVSEWGYKMFDIDTSNLPLNTEVEVPFDVDIDFTNGDWGRAYYSIGDYVGKMDFSDCHMNFRIGQWPSRTPYNPGEFECRMTVTGPMTFSISPENGSYMSPATKLAYEWRQWPDMMVPIQYIYWGEQTSSGPIRLPDDIRTLEMVADGVYPAGWGKDIGVWEKPGEMGWAALMSDDSDDGGADDSGSAEDTENAGDSGNAGEQEVKVLTVNLENGGVALAKNGSDSSVEGSSASESSEDEYNSEKEEKTVSGANTAESELNVPAASGCSAEKKFLPWILIPVAFVTGFLLAWWVLPGRKTAEKTEKYDEKA